MHEPCPIDPVSATYNALEQTVLARSLAKRPSIPPTLRSALQRASSSHERLRRLARFVQRTATRGQALGELEIPRLGLAVIAVEGADSASLKRGPGFFNGVLPGSPGTVAIAGRSAVYGAAFRRLNLLVPGDLVTLRMSYGRFVYSVQTTRIVERSDTSVLKAGRSDRLLLSALHPPCNERQRITVAARLREAQPLGPATVAP